MFELGDNHILILRAIDESPDGFVAADDLAGAMNVDDFDRAAEQLLRMGLIKARLLPPGALSLARLTPQGRQFVEDWNARDADVARKVNERIRQESLIEVESLGQRPEVVRAIYKHLARFWFSRFIVSVDDKLDEIGEKWSTLGRLAGRHNLYHRFIENAQMVGRGEYVADAVIGGQEIVLRILLGLDKLCEQRSDKDRLEINVRLSATETNFVAFQSAMVCFDDTQKRTPITLFEVICILYFFRLVRKDRQLDEALASEILMHATRRAMAIGVSTAALDLAQLQELIEYWAQAFTKASSLLIELVPQGTTP